MKWASFKRLPSPFVIGANNLTARSSLFTHTPENLECKMNKISLEHPFYLNEKPCYRRVLQKYAFCSCQCERFAFERGLLKSPRRRVDGNASSAGLCLLAFLWSVVALCVVFVWAAVTKVPEAGELRNSRNLFHTILQAGKSEIKSNSSEVFSLVPS